MWGPRQGLDLRGVLVAGVVQHQRHRPPQSGGGDRPIWASLHRLRTSGRLRPGDRVLVLGAETTKYVFGGFVYTH
jgi:hypothetical protein